MYKLRTYREFELQKQVCKYLSAQYPKTLFLSDTIASLRLTGAQQGRNGAIQKKGFHCPDLLILEPQKGYHGLFIELKVETPYKKDGTLKKSDHLKGQEESMQTLREKGYFAVFAWEFEKIKEIIDWYLNKS